MKAFLRDPENRGYPTDYLLARLKARRAHLVADWKPLIWDLSVAHLPSLYHKGTAQDDSPEWAWRWLNKEYRWVYYQMNETLREVFRPFFLYAEFRTLAICLRHLRYGHREAKIDTVLASSLLSEKVVQVFKKADDYLSAMAALEDIFTSLSPCFRGVSRNADTAGSREMEAELTNRYLAYVAKIKLHPIMKSFFIQIIDARNIMSLYKYLRLDEKTAHPLIQGGSVDAVKLSELAVRKDLLAMIPLIKKYAGTSIDKPDATSVEKSLYLMITHHLKRAAGDPLGIGLILYYLWRCSLEATNLSVLSYGRELDRDAVAAELGI